MKLGFGLIGAGNLGLSIASALQKSLGRITGLYDPDEVNQKKAVMVLECPVLSIEDLAKSSDVLLFAVPDEEISRVFKHIHPRLSETSLLVHFSGVLSSEVFGNAPIRISAHPTRAFPQSTTDANAFKNVLFALEGTECAVDIFQPVLEEIGANCFTISADAKPLYHTVCVMASNLVVGLLEATTKLSTKTGVDKGIMRQCILELSSGAITDARAAETLAKALSGPVVRGDRTTVALHLKVLERFPAQRKLYRMLSQWVLELAKERGLERAKAQEIEKTLLG